MIPYSLHVALILTIWIVFYKLLLHKETYYRLNRVMLLCCLILSFILPLIPVSEKFSLRDKQPEIIHIVTQPDHTPSVLASSPSTIAPSPEIIKASEPIPEPVVPISDRIIQIIFWVYWCGVVVFAANLLLQIVVLMYQAYRKPVIKDGIYRIVEMDGDKAPCSFGNTIFINPTKYDWETYNQIIIHEKVHIQQGHSFDLMFAELVLVVQWFNPFAWMYRKELESNLEFLTDYSVLNRHNVALEDYQLSLLKVAIPNQSMNITTNYNQSLLKKRIVMMNAKKSNVHTMWKYFMILPLMAVVLCGLNKPVAMGSKPVAETELIAEKFANSLVFGQSKGLWFATIKNDQVQVEFKSDDYEDRNYRWSTSSTFNLKDFSNLPKDNKGDFTVIREAGTITFNGKFDDDQGFGRFKFEPNKEYKSFLSFKGIGDLKDEEYFSFFVMDVKKKYIQFLNDNGFKSLSKNQIISMSAFKIGIEDINYWKKIGYDAITPNNLVSLKSMKIDSTYVNDIRKAGYTDLTVQQLISFKAQGITGNYINSLRKATLRKPTADQPVADKPSPNEIIKSKVMKIDTNYVAAIRDTGFPDLSSNALHTLKTKNISPAEIKSYQELGLKNLTPSLMYSLKTKGITPEYIQSFYDMGLKDIPVNTFYTLKSQGITAAYVQSFYDIGLKDISFNQLYTLKSQSITPAYIKSFQEIGLKDISYHTLYTLKTQGITPDYVKSFQDIGLQDISFNTLYILKVQHITPAYIKSFMDIGLKNIPYNQYATLKNYGITASYINGFQKLGFPNITLSETMALRNSGVTPEYVADMKQKGFNLKDLSKYIQLKSFSNENTAKAKNK